jgi:ParB family chromosome partitioning protein
MHKMSEQNYIPTKYDSVFWVEVERIVPNPYQPRIEFDEERLKSLAESIRQYGVLQPLVVTRAEREKPDGGIQTTYELIAGERRLRASRLIGLREVPVVIRQGEQSDKMKLELAIIENLQREDLNAIDRAKALAQLAETFGLSHSEIGEKVGRSREYVSNSIRLLNLPEAIQNAVVGKEITEGHARALLMLSDRPSERDTLFKEILLKKTSVRMVEQMARRLAQDKIRKRDKTPEMMELEKSLTETLGTRVLIENRPNGGRVLIEFFSPEDLSHIAAILAERKENEAAMSPLAEASAAAMVTPSLPTHPNTTQLPPLNTLSEPPAIPMPGEVAGQPVVPQPSEQPAQPKPQAEPEDLYAVQNFTV